MATSLRRWRDVAVRPEDRRLWATLTQASAVAAVAVLPYLMEMQHEAFAAAAEQRSAAGKRPIRTAELAAAVWLQSQLSFGLVAALGLRAARATGLEAPHLRAWLQGEPTTLEANKLAVAGATGVGAAAVLVLADRLLFARVAEQMRERGVREPAPWRGLLATAYGAIAEEVLLRHGLQSILAAGIQRLRGATARPASGATMWPAIGLASVGFGVGHLPAAAAIMPLSRALVARILLLNGVAGGLFGFLYWQRGLEAAMAAHAATDVALHVALPLWRSANPRTEITPA